MPSLLGYLGGKEEEEVEEEEEEDGRKGWKEGRRGGERRGGEGKGREGRQDQGGEDKLVVMMVIQDTADHLAPRQGSSGLGGAGRNAGSPTPECT